MLGACSMVYSVDDMLLFIVLVILSSFPVASRCVLLCESGGKKYVSFCSRSEKARAKTLGLAS